MVSEMTRTQAQRVERRIAVCTVTDFPAILLPKKNDGALLTMSLRKRRFRGLSRSRLHFCKQGREGFTPSLPLHRTYRSGIRRYIVACPAHQKSTSSEMLIVCI